MLESRKELQSAKTDKNKTYYDRKCESLDRNISYDVYRLDGLTE